MNKRVVSVGIISYEDYKHRTMAIAQGTYRPKPGEPKIWFESLETMVNVFNSQNQQLLRIILEQQPESIRVLEKLTGRSRRNLSETLHVMERYGIVELQKHNGSLKPIVKATDFRVEFGLYHQSEYAAL